MEKQSRTLDRRLVVIGAVLIQPALGAVYAWSVFTARLTDSSGTYIIAGFVCLLGAVIMTLAKPPPIEGRLQKKAAGDTLAAESA